ncbi:MAG: hypothetical protein ACLFRV_03970 [Acidimicrobiales bacterium]
MTTAGDLVELTRNRYINAGHREERNRLAAAIDETAETFTTSWDLGPLTRGARISIGLEDMYVWSAEGKSVDADRGQFGTTATAHDEGDRILVNARPTPADTLAALNETVTDLSNRGIFAVDHVDITTDGASTAYNLPATNWIGPLDVRIQTKEPAEDWPLLTRWRVADGIADDGDYEAGRVIRLFDALPSGRTVRVRYKTELTPALSSLDDNVEDKTGLYSWAVDLLPLGAALSLIAGREVARNRDDRQGDTRRANEVPPNAQLISSRGLSSQYESRLTAVRRRLLATYQTRLKATRF